MVARFTLRQLEYFVTAVEEGSFRAAAAVCRVTETALAQSITDLESTLSQSLFIRQRSRGVIATAEGRALLPIARSMLDQADEFTSAASELHSGLIGPLRVGCYSNLSPFILPSVHADFATAHPGLEVTVIEGDAHFLQGELLAGRLDCVLLQQRQAIPGVETHSLGFGVPTVILAANHPMANLDAVSLRELEAEPMVLLDLPAVRSTLLALLGEVGVTPRVEWRTTVFETVRSLVARNLGWSILIHRPPSSISYEGLPLVTRPTVEALASSDVALAVLKGRRLSAKIATLEEHCRVFLARLETEEIRLFVPAVGEA